MPVKVVGGGVLQSGCELAVDPTFLAGRIALRPSDYANSGFVRGYYRCSTPTPPNFLTAAANAVLMSLRWGNSQFYLVLISVTVSISVSSAVSAQRTDPITLTIQRKYTSNETTALVNAQLYGPLSGENTQKMRATAMKGSLVSQLAFNSLAGAGISGGTRTADAQPIGTVALTGLGAIGSGILPTSLYDWDVFGQHPVVLSKDEGLTSSWGTTALATGTVMPVYTVDWAEVAVY